MRFEPEYEAEGLITTSRFQDRIKPLIHLKSLGSITKPEYFHRAEGSINAFILSWESALVQFSCSLFSLWYFG